MCGIEAVQGLLADTLQFLIGRQIQVDGGHIGNQTDAGAALCLFLRQYLPLRSLGEIGDAPKKVEFVGRHA